MPKPIARADYAAMFGPTTGDRMRLDIASGPAVRFEPDQRREVSLIPYYGARRVFGFNQQIMGKL